MDQVEKEKSKNTKKETKPYVQQIYDIIKILNGAFKDFPDPEQGKEVRSIRELYTKTGLSCQKAKLH